MRNGFTFSQVEKLNKTNSNPIQGNKPMKITIFKLATFAACVLALFQLESKAAVQIRESLMTFGVNGVDQATVVDVFRQGSRTDEESFHNPRLNNNLNTVSFDLSAGDSLVLKALKIRTNHWNSTSDGAWTPAGAPNSNNWIDPSSNQMRFFYSVTPQSGSDSWSSIVIPHLSSNGNQHTFEILNLATNLLSATSAGNSYTLKAYFEVEYNSWVGETVENVTGDGSALTPAGSAAFNVIPEPSSSLLMGLGLAGLVALRLRRHRA